MDLQITIVDETTGLVTLGLPRVPKILTGLDKLVQLVALSFLRNPGKSVFWPTEGSGLRADIGFYNYHDVAGAEIRVRAVQAVKDVEAEIIARQDPNSGSPDERLQKLELRDFAFDPETYRAILAVQIVAESGDNTNLLI